MKAFQLLEMIVTKKYQVFVDDNYHYGSESDRMPAGSYRSLDKAIEKCKKVTISSLKYLCEEGMAPEKLSAQWSMFGDDPFIVGSDSIPFSAREFVTKKLCKSIIDAK